MDRNGNSRSPLQRCQMDFLVVTWSCQVVLCISRYKTGQTGSRPKQGKMQVKQLWSTVGPASSAPPDISRLFTRTHHHEYCSQAHIIKNIVHKQTPSWILFTSTHHQEYCSQAHTTKNIVHKHTPKCILVPASYWSTQLHHYEDEAALQRQTILCFLQLGDKHPKLSISTGKSGHVLTQP